MGRNPSRFKGDDLPVEQVSWFDAVEFCSKLSVKEGKKPRYRLANVERKEGSIASANVTILTDGNGYRLPTEAEWEYACRAGTKTPFWFGETITTDQPNFDGNFPYREADGKGESRSKTTPVKQFKANEWKLHDMHGNLFQWCQDWYDEYPNEDINDPEGPERGTSRVLRGGSWSRFAWNCRAANRNRIAPANRNDNIGFRVALRLHFRPPNGDPGIETFTDAPGVVTGSPDPVPDVPATLARRKECRPGESGRGDSNASPGPCSKGPLATSPKRQRGGSANPSLALRAWGLWPNAIGNFARLYLPNP